MKRPKTSRKTKSAQPRSLHAVVGLRPMDCERIADVCSLERSYQESGRFSMLIQHDGAVILADHVPGQPQTASITIPRRHFHRLVAFYQTEQPNEKLTDGSTTKLTDRRNSSRTVWKGNMSDTKSRSEKMSRKPVRCSVLLGELDRTLRIRYEDAVLRHGDVRLHPNNAKTEEYIAAIVEARLKLDLPTDIESLSSDLALEEVKKRRTVAG